MELGFMRYSISEIEDLKYLFETEYKSIIRKSKKGMKKYRFDFSISVYLNSKLSNDSILRNNKSYDDFCKYMEEYIDIVEIRDNEPKTITYRLKNLNKLGIDENDFDANKGRNEFRKYMQMPITFCNETIIMLLVKFENIIANSMKILFSKFPDKYLKNKTISYAELVQLQTDDLESYVIDNSVEDIMRESFNKWFGIFESHKMNFEKYNIMNEFAEIYYRRNLIVHNNSIVNSTYLSLLKNSNIKLPPKGVAINSDEKYVDHAINVIECVILSLFIECAKLQNDDNKSIYFEEIFNIGFDFLKKQNYLISFFVFKHIEKSKHIDEKTKNMSTVNRWLSQKALTGLAGIKEEVLDTDFSALRDDFVLAKYILLEDYENALPILEKLFPSEIPPYVLEDWPLFCEFRETRYYDDFKLNHKHEFELKGLESSEMGTESNISLTEITSNIGSDS